MRWQFEGFVFDVEAREVFRAGIPVRLSPKALRLLEVLIAAAPAALSREELYRMLWGDALVEETNLPTLIHEVRSALSDDAKQARFVKTVHRFGYRFAGEVRQAEDGSASAAMSRFAVKIEGRLIPLTEGANLVGRAHEASVRLDSSHVSRRHASFVIDGPRVTVEDLGCKNGTFVRGERTCGAVPVFPGDVVHLGRLPVVLHLRSLNSTITCATPALVKA